MTNLATLTMNPTVDVSFEVDRMVPTHKNRGRDERHDPGGGGINVARVFARLGGNARCFYLAGGAAGAALDMLMDRHGLVRCRIDIDGETRVAMAVLDRETGLQYRLVADGPEISPETGEQCLKQLEAADFDYLVASGTLPRGLPDDFYARVAAMVAKRGKRMVLDSSGRGLAHGLAGGNIFLAKPSLEELRALCGRRLEHDEEIAEAGREIVRQGLCENLAVTLGSDGAFLINAQGTLRLPAVPVESVSAVGSGDSFVAAMIFGLAAGRTMEDAFRFGLAGGAAAVMTPGTDLALADDIYRLYAAAQRLVR
jgi:6-phosphofructokinase 2